MKKREKIINVVLIVLAVALFSTGYIISANFLKKPLNENQFDLYEKVAQDVYEHGNQIIVEAPNDVTISKTATTITVKPKFGFAGKVEAKLKNGELVFTRFTEKGESIFFNILMGIEFVLVYILLVLIIWKIRDKN